MRFGAGGRRKSRCMRFGSAFDKPHSCIRAVLLPRGGIPPVAYSPLNYQH